MTNLEKTDSRRPKGRPLTKGCEMEKLATRIQETRKETLVNDSEMVRADNDDNFNDDGHDDDYTDFFVPISATHGLVGRRRVVTLLLVLDAASESLLHGHFSRLCKIQKLS